MVLASGSGIDYERLIQQDRVHSKLYTDEAAFANELEQVWYREWIFIGHESEIGAPGDYVLKWLGLQPVIMTRDEDGGVNLLLNHCTHRGASVCQDEAGNSHAFRCWYHGWTFNNRGDLVGVTYKEGFGEDFDARDFGLARVPRVGSYRGFVFGSMSPEGVSLEEHLGHAKAEVLDRLCDLSPVGEVELTAGWLKHRVDANWKMMMENACDFYHPSFAHQSSRLIRRKNQGNGGSELELEPVMEQAGRRAVVRDLGRGHADIDLGDRGSGANGYANLGELSQNYFASLKEAYGEDKALQLLAGGPPHATIFPNLFVAGQNLFVVRPISVGSMVSMQTPVFFKGVPGINERQLRRFEGAAGPAGMLEQDDGEIWERNQRGLRTRMPEWQVIKRGNNRETQLANGIIVSRDVMDETPMRGFWRHYKQLVTRPGL